MWDETIAAIAVQSGGTARCLALDAPGSGRKRAVDTGAITFDQTVEELIADVEAAGMGGSIIVGHSQAGCVLPRMAELRPDLFSRQIYISCVAPLDGLTVAEMAMRHIHGDDPDHPMRNRELDPTERHQRLFCNDMDRATATAFIARLGLDGWPPSAYTHSQWRYDHLAALPVTYVLCLADACMPLAWQERFATTFHATRRLRIDAGHQVMNTRPQALAEILLAEAAITAPA